MVAPAPLETERCRQFLEAIIAGGRSLDPKGAADGLIEEFGSLAAAVAAPRARQVRAARNDRAAVRQLTEFHRAMTHVLRHRLAKRPILSDSRALLDYLAIGMAHEPKERFRVLFLNGRNALLRDETLWSGTVNGSAVYVREILSRAIELGAAGLIAVHNHPSGDPSPSPDDIAVTKELDTAGRALRIVVHDHLIVGLGQIFSFRKAGLL